MLTQQVSRLLRRAPWRTALSWILILIMALLLALGVGLAAGNCELRERAKEDYVTLAVFDGDGDADFSALLEDPAVLRAYYPTEKLLSLAGYHSKSADAYQDRCIFVLSGVVANTVGCYNGHVREQLYYAKELADEYTVTVSGLPEDIGREERIVVHGVVGYGSTGLAHIDIMPIGELPGYQRLGENEEIPTEYRLLAEEYTAVNSRVMVCPTGELETLAVFHQCERTVESGRAFTEEEYRENAACAIITGEIASQMSLAVGDAITLSGEEVDSVYEVIGITNTSSEMTPTVYLPVSSAERGEPLTSEALRLLLKNDQAAAFAARAEQLLPQGVRMTVYDQGYAAVVSNLENIGRIARIIVALSCLLTAATLLLLAYRWFAFIRESMITMLLLGSGKGFVRGYLLLSGGIIAGAGAVVGSLLGAFFSGGAITALYLLVEKSREKEKFYQLSSLGVARPLTLSAPLPLAEALLAALAVTLAALLLLLLFSRPILRRVKKSRKKPRIASQKLRTVRAGGVWKYALTSILRSPAGNLALLLTAFITTLTIVAVTMAGVSAKERLEEAAEGYTYPVSIRSYNGRATDGILIARSVVDEIKASGLTVQSAYAVRDRMVLGGKKGEETPFIWPTGGFALETFANKIKSGPSIVYTNDLSFLPEFASGAEITYEAGFTEEAFEAWEDGEVIPLLMSRSVMEENDLKLGDEVVLYLRIDTDKLLFGTDTFRIVGSYQPVTDRLYAYAPLRAVAPDDAEQPLTQHQLDYGGYLYAASRRFWQDESKLPITEKMARTGLDESLTYDAAGFRVTRENIADFEELLWNQGFSAVGKLKRIRTFVTVDDLLYEREIAPLERYVKTVRILFPVIFLLVAAEGYVASYLVINGRKNEMLIMRGLGASKKQVFGTFFVEQALLCLIGGVTGLLLAGPVIGLTGGILWRWGLFVACYLFGTAASILRAIRSDDLQSAFAALES